MLIWWAMLTAFSQREIVHRLCINCMSGGAVRYWHIRPWCRLNPDYLICFLTWCKYYSTYNLIFKSNNIIFFNKNKKKYIYWSYKFVKKFVSVDWTSVNKNVSDSRTSKFPCHRIGKQWIDFMRWWYIILVFTV